MTISGARLLKEPLVQFLLLGAVVFGAERYVFVTTDQPQRIVIDDARYRELVDIFQEGQSRAPSSAEMDELILTWAQNEVFYREALAMELDRGDEMIRQRLILKYRDILFNNLIVELPPDDVLEAWFEEHRAAYDRPALVDFEQFLVADRNEREARTLARELGDGRHPERYGGVLRVYRQRPEGNLYSAFGEDGGKALLGAGDNDWTAVQSDHGWHLARITRRYPAEPADFASVRHDIAADWLKQAREREMAATLKEVVDEYDIRYSLSRDLVERSVASRGTDGENTGS
ncbi:MAG: peptidylprolyl isomerase [Pseudomonadota bacterium]